MIVEKKKRESIKQIGLDVQPLAKNVVIAIANALGLKIRYDKDEDGKVIGVSAYGGRCLRLADHCTYMQTWVDAGTWNSPYRNDIVICDNPSEQFAKTQVQSGYDFTISEFLYGTQDMTVEKAKMIAYDIKQAINVGQYANNARGEKRILTSTHDADDNPQSTQDATEQNITNNQENKQDTNMKTENRKRNVVRLTESQLKQMITESVKKVLNEYDDVYGTYGPGYEESPVSMNGPIHYVYMMNTMIARVIKLLEADCHDENGHWDNNIADEIDKNILEGFEKLYYYCKPFCTLIEQYLSEKNR